MKKGIGFILCIALLSGMFFLPAAAAEENYALGKPATTNSVYADDAKWSAGAAFDGDASTRWASKAGETEYWIQVDLEQTRSINKMTFQQYQSRVLKYSVEVSADNLVWTTAAEGDSMGVNKEITFPKADARYVRFNILEWSAEPTFYEITVSGGTEAAMTTTGNLALKRPVTASSEHSATYDASKIVDGKMDTRWAAFSSEGAPDADCRWINIDLGAVKPINQMKIYEFSARIQDYKIMGSADGETWNELKSGTLSGNNKNTTLEFPVACVRYVKLEIYQYTDHPTIWEIELYCTSAAGDYLQYYQFADFVNASVLTDQPTDAITGNLNMPLPNSVTAGSLTADVTWESDKPDVINAQTGEVTRQAEDTPVTITARAAIRGMTEVPPVEISFTVTVKAAAADIPVLEVLQEPVTVETEPWTADLKQQSGFDLNAPLAAELDVSAQNAQNMTVSLGQENAPFAQIQFTGDTYSIAYGSPMRLWRKEGNYPAQGAHVKFRFEINRMTGTMDALVDEGTGWKTALHNVKGMNTISALDKIWAAFGSGSLSVHSAQVRMTPKLAVELLKEQFDFTKLSDEKSMCVSKDLTLPKTLLAAPAQWQSSNEAAINTETGAVDTTQSGITTLTVTAAFGSEVFEKSFRVMFGGGNLLAGAAVETTGKSISGGGIENLLDEDMDTSYLTRSTKPYEITVDFPQETVVSHLTLFEASKSTGKITKFSIEAKNEIGDYEQIAQGTEIGEELTVPCALRETTQLKIKVEAFEKGSTGFAEITGSYAPTAAQVLEGDLAVIGMYMQAFIDMNVLPAIGIFGSELTWTSSNTDLMKLERQEDVYILKPTYGAQTKVINLRVDARYQQASDMRAYTVGVEGTGGSVGAPGGSNGGTSGSSGGGGGNRGGGSSGGTGGIGMQVPIVSDTNVKPVPLPTPDTKAELNGHWAQTELGEIVDRGILQGDGTSLRLADGVTRAEFAAMLSRTLQLSAADYRPTFGDVPADAWYAGVVLAAADAGLMEGSGGMLRPEDPITREEMAKIVVKAYAYRGKTLPETEESAAFTDEETISGWARETVAQAVKLGLIQGYETGEFLPQAGLLREQAAVVLYRLMEIL
ncbi:MAG: hypothetical protein HFI90_08915 [Clostridia bacterium]|nr:hypothetical protein [Clostridia bacterium]